MYVIESKNIEPIVSIDIEHTVQDTQDNQVIVVLLDSPGSE